MSPISNPRQQTRTVQRAIMVSAMALMAIAFLSWGMRRAHGQDLSVFDMPEIVAEPEAISFARFDCVATISFQAFDPVESISFEAFDTRTKNEQKPAIKPSRQALEYLRKSVEVGEDVGAACVTVPVTVAAYDYPLRAHTWTHPGNIRQHVLSGQHAGKLTADQVAKMSDAELEAWHSDDHEGKAVKPVAVQVAAAPNWGGYREFIWLDGSRHATPQPGAYYPTFGRVLVPAGTSVPVSQPVRVQSGCPGGVCPVRRRG